MDEELVTFETALMLKKLGFNEETRDYYADGELNGDFDLDEWKDYNSYEGFEEEELCSAPTQSFAMRWLRKEFDIFIEIGTRESSPGLYFVNVISKKTLKEGNAKGYKTYEAAVEDGLRHACQYLAK